MAEHVTSEESELYALGVLDGDEKTSFETHLRSCSDCTRSLASAHQRVALIGLACVPETPRPAVREKIMRRILAERVGDWTQEKTAQITELRVELEPEPEPEPVAEAEPEPTAVAVQEGATRRVQWLAAGLTVLLLAAVSAGLWVMHRSHGKQPANLQEQTQESQASQPNTAAEQPQSDQNAKPLPEQKDKTRTDANRASDAPAAVAQHPAGTAASEPETLASTLITPTRISASVAHAGETAPPPSLAVGADLGADRSGGLPVLPASTTEPRVQPGDPGGPMRISSGVAAARLIAPIQPVYPDLARQAHIEGTVVVEATISTAGRVRYVHVLSGPALLTAAALSAVQRARYRPFMMNGAPVEAQTTITLIFKLNN